MLILLKHILRNIRQNKFRSILIIISLAISTMVLFLNLTIKDDLVKKYTSVLQGAYQDYDLVAYSNASDDNGFFQQEEMDLSGIDADHILYISAAFGVYMQEEENLTINLLGVDRQMLQDTNLCRLEEKSKDYNPANEGQILISRKTADKFDWKLDDIITIYTKDGEHELTIAGIAQTSGFFLTEFDNFYIITPRDFTSRCSGEENSIAQVIIDLPKDSDLKGVEENFENANHDFGMDVLTDSDSIENALTTINQLLTIILCMVIGLNIFIIASITKLIMATRIPVVGTFRSVGASKRKMNFILILENAVFGLFGAVIGIGLGILVRNPMSDLFISAGDAFEYLNVKLEYKVSYVIISICFAVGLQVLITLSSILKASRRSIKDNIFNTLSTRARISKKKTILGIILLSVSIVIYFVNIRYQFLPSILAIIFALAGAVYILPILTKYLAELFALIFGKLFGGAAGLGMKNISSSKTIRSSITLIAVGLSLILMVYGATTSLNKMFETDDINYDIRITGLIDPASEYQYIDGLEGIDHIQFDYYYFLNGKMNGKDKTFAVVGTSRYHSGLNGDTELLENLKDDEILVDDYYAFKNRLEIGEDVTLESEFFNSKVKTYRIAGFIDATNFNSLRNVFIITEEEYYKELGKIPSIIEVYTNQDIKQTKEMLIKKLAGTGASVETLDEYIARQKQSNQSILNMVSVILGLSIILAVFGLINNQMIGFIQRKREYAVLYSVSMSRSQLRKMIFCESLGTFLAGGTIGFILSQWLIRLLYGVLMSIGMGYPLALKFSSMLQVGGIVLIILLITTISPVRKISRLNIVNELKYE
jgi:putative ABC transport system permease protein